MWLLAAVYLGAGVAAIAGIILNEHWLGKWTSPRSAFDWAAILFALVAWPWAVGVYCAERLRSRGV